MRKTAKKNKTMVTFELPAEAAGDQVVVVGDFNEWSEVTNPMKRRKDGSFSVTLSLPTGRQWRFRYLVDGRRWANDWTADSYEPNSYGSEDSIVVT